MIFVLSTVYFQNVFENGRVLFKTLLKIEDLIGLGFDLCLGNFCNIVCWGDGDYYY